MTTFNYIKQKTDTNKDYLTQHISILSFQGKNLLISTTIAFAWRSSKKQSSKTVKGSKLKGNYI